MEEYQTRGISPSAAFFVLVAFVVAGLFIGSLITAVFWVAMTGNSIFNLARDMTDPRFANAARVVQVVSVLFAFYIPAFVTVRLMNYKPLGYLGYKEGFTARQLLMVALIMLACLPMVGALSELTQLMPLPKSAEALFKRMEDNYSSQAEALATMRSFGEFIFSLIVMALLPALFEETLFRGGMQQILIAWFKKPVTAIIVTSIIFSLMHFSFYGFFARFALGMVLGLIFYYSKSIWLSMAAHFINNGIAICYMYYLSTHGRPVKDAMEDNAPVWLGLPAVVLLALLIRYFAQISAKRHIDKIPPMDGPSINSNLA
jgi:membrane protease YdiL (CAAX protease family)